ncbi:hypothetical protein RND71_031997 [Anisodus tanguticus]|uniref:Uncharacterized protein n=1 Tax=Anisodus tanguticus TaxID=243964 RepID=A0AAE1REB9_9SOLA|nr:hypothetical protein RND71_031997 [Anisodus tanguticus]
MILKARMLEKWWSDGLELQNRLKPGVFKMRLTGFGEMEDPDYNGGAPEVGITTPTIVATAVYSSRLIITHGRKLKTSENTLRTLTSICYVQDSSVDHSYATPKAISIMWLQLQRRLLTSNGSILCDGPMNFSNSTIIEHLFPINKDFSENPVGSPGMLFILFSRDQCKVMDIPHVVLKAIHKMKQHGDAPTRKHESLTNQRGYVLANFDKTSKVRQDVKHDKSYLYASNPSQNSKLPQYQWFSRSIRYGEDDSYDYHSCRVLGFCGLFGCCGGCTGSLGWKWVKAFCGDVLDTLRVILVVGVW